MILAIGVLSDEQIFNNVKNLLLEPKKLWLFGSPLRGTGSNIWNIDLPDVVDVPDTIRMPKSVGDFLIELFIDRSQQGV